MLAELFVCRKSWNNSKINTEKTTQQILLCVMSTTHSLLGKSSDQVKMETCAGGTWVKRAFKNPRSPFRLTFSCLIHVSRLFQKHKQRETPGLTLPSVTFSGLINKSLDIEVPGLFVLRVTPVPAVCIASTCSYTGHSPLMSCVLWTNSERGPDANALIYSTNMGSKKRSQIWHTDIKSERNHIIFSTRIVSFKRRSKCKHECQKAPWDYIIQQCINKSSVMLVEV